jgi:hypothetical protein
MLTAKQKEDWVVALKSGKYRQTKAGEEGFGQLKSEAGYCCLGVLAELNGWETGNRFLLRKEGIQAAGPVGGGVSASFGGFSACGLPYTFKGYHSLAQLNDSGVSFAEIADFLAKNLPTSG